MTWPCRKKKKKTIMESSLGLSSGRLKFIYKLYLRNMDTSLLRAVHLVLAQRDQNSDKLYLYNKDTSLLQTVHLVSKETKTHINSTSVLQIPLYYGQFTWSKGFQNSDNLYWFSLSHNQKINLKPFNYKKYEFQI